MSGLRRFRRLRAIAVQLLFAQLAVASGIGTCPLGDGMAAGAEIPMTQTASHAQHHAPASDAPDRPGPASPAGHHHTGAHCDMACAPASCGSAGHCSAAATSSSATSPATLASAHGRRITVPDRAPRSVSIAPEPPPPRA